MTLKERIEAVVSEMDADILGPRPRQIPKRWPDDLRTLAVEVGAMEERFLSGQQIMEHYVPGYKRQEICESCGGPIRLQKFEEMP